MSKRPLCAALCIAALVMSSACVIAPTREVRYAPVAAARVPVEAEFGTVSRVEVIATAAPNNAVGAVLGALLGGVIGNRFGDGSGRAVATGLGVVGGAVAGDAIEKLQRRDAEVSRVSVRFDNGSVREFDFQRVDDLRKGDRVKFEGGQLHRL